jgi:hypothetical protein
MRRSDYTADKHALKQAKQEEQERRGNADLGQRRQQSERRRREPTPITAAIMAPLRPCRSA